MKPRKSFKFALNKKKLSLADSLNKYSSQLIIDVIEVDDEDESGDESLVSVVHGSDFSTGDIPCTSKRPVLLLNRKASKRFKYCPTMEIEVEDDGESSVIESYQRTGLLLCPPSNVLLRGDHIYQALTILGSQFENIGGLVDTVVLQADESRAINLNLKENNVFVLHTPKLDHWVVLTNINHFADGKWIPYGSLNHLNYLKSLRQTIVRICSAFSSSKNRVSVYTVNMAQQLGMSDCGLFALAYAVELCFNNDPAKLTFEQPSMRAHYDSCLKLNSFTSFKSQSRDITPVYTAHKFNQIK